jgi:methionine aminopeptidase
MEYREVQQIAKDTVAYLKTVIAPGMQLRELRRLCEAYMLSHGCESFWYWDIGAFVFAGDETAVSVSGREYRTSDRLIAENDIVTVDLSPQHGDIWGDYARTVVLWHGKVAESRRRPCRRAVR